MLIGLAVWCACGHLAVASDANPRIVIPAPWWTFVLGVVGAALVPGFRRDPLLALPAVLSTIPWWPVPLSAVALIWTGPLAWGPILLAVGAALLSRAPVAEPATAPAVRASASAGSPKSGVWLAGGLSAAMLIAAAWSASPRVPGGDEPHYVAISQSLIRDGDLRIENNHHDADFVAAFGDIKPDFIKRGRDGEIYSIHAPGLAAIVAPAFAVAGYRGAQATIIALTAWAGALVWAIGWRVTRNSRAAWFGWAAIAGSATFLLQGFVVFPDAPGAFAVAAGTWLIVRLADAEDRVAPAVLAAVSVILAGLPWLHTRFSVIAAGLGLVVAWLVLTDASRPLPERLRRLMTFGAIPAISAIAWFGYFQVIYGTPNPAVPYGDTSGPDGTHLSYAPGGLTGLFFDEQFGLFVYAPVLVVAVLGLARLSRDRIGRAALSAAGVAALYLAIAATYWMWWAGVPATPARLVTATLPVLAVPLARSWHERAHRRAAMAMALGVTLALSLIVIGVDRAALAWNVRDAEARWLQWLGPVVNLRRGWPSFFWRLDPAKPLSEMPFLFHVALWLVLWGIGWLLLVKPRRAERVALGVAWWVLVTISFGVGLSWGTQGADLDPVRAQFVVLSEMARGHRAFRVASASVQRIASPAGIMRIKPAEAGPEGTRPWAIWEHVPAGTYQVRLELMKPRAGQVRVAFGLSEVLPPATIDLPTLSQQVFPIVVPAGVDRLSIELDDGLQGVMRRIELEPISVGR